MDQAENHPSLAKATAERRAQARRHVWEAYCYPKGKDDHVRKIAPPQGRFADPMSQIQAGETGR